MRQSQKGSIKEPAMFLKKYYYVLKSKNVVDYEYHSIFAGKK